MVPDASTYTLGMFRSGLDEDEMVQELVRSFTETGSLDTTSLPDGQRLQEAVRNYVRSRIFEFTEGSKSSLV